MEIIGYFTALLIGISLGLIGGGGSILTIPVLVYLFGLNPLTATGYSLFIVGFSSLVGAIFKYRHREVDTRAAAYFGITSIITVLLVRKFILPAIPDQLFSIGQLQMTKSLATLLLFAIIMIISSIHMIGKNPKNNLQNNQPVDASDALTRGIGVGVLTGFIGAGGGFVIIPVLLFSFQLPMKTAIGTSLLIIAANSLIGFAGDLLNGDPINWLLLGRITAISCFGIFIGDLLSNRITGNRLKKGFGFFVLSVGCYIILHEIFKAF
ncbi:MAG: sulfite exporter TauE/SafE family protein [Sediminibacterium sp.]|nr:sulfite exporter TauE/SafE family protein [Sediminibacterium sp.]